MKFWLQGIVVAVMLGGGLGGAAQGVVQGQAELLDAKEEQAGESFETLADRFQGNASEFCGTWADAKGQPLIVVVDMDYAWLWQTNQWKLMRFHHKGRRYAILSPDGETPDDALMMRRVTGDEVGPLRAEGFSFSENEWVFGRSPMLAKSFQDTRGRAYPLANVTSQVERITHIDESLLPVEGAATMADFVGVWRVGPALPAGARGRYFAVGADGTGGFFIRDEDGDDLFGVRYELTLEIGGLRAVRVQDVDRGDILENCAFLAYDKEQDALIWGGRYDRQVFPRVRGLRNPFERVKEMVKQNAYFGEWGGGERETSFSVMLEEDGRALYGTQTGVYRGTWTSDGQGQLTLALKTPFGQETNIVARLNTETNVMRLFSPEGQVVRVAGTNTQRERHPIDKFDQQRREERRVRLEEKKKSEARLAELIETVVVTNTCQDMADLFRWAAQTNDETKVTVQLEAIDSFGRFMLSRDYGRWNVNLVVGVAEGGKRPAEEEIDEILIPFGRQLRIPVSWRESPAWRELNQHLVSIGAWTTLRAYLWLSAAWYRGENELVAVVPEAQRLELEAVLADNFASRFPCKVTVTRKSRRQTK